MCYIKAKDQYSFFVSSSENYFPYKETTEDTLELAEKAAFCSAELERQPRCQVFSLSQQKS